MFELKYPILTPATIIVGLSMATLIPSILSVLPLISEYFSDVAHIDFLVKMMITATGIVAALSAPFVGAWINTIGKKNLFLIAIAGMVLFGVIPYFLDSIYLILASRLCLGIIQAALLTVTAALIASYYHAEKRTQMMGFHGSALGIGPILGLVAMGYLGDFGWRYVFLIYLVPALLLPCIIVFIYDYEPSSQPDEVSPITENNILSIFLYYPQLPFIYMLIFICTLLVFMIALHIPFFVNNHHQVQPSDIAIVMATWTIFKGVTSILYKNLKAIMNFNQVFAIAFGIVGLGFIGLNFTQTYAHILIVVAIMGIGTGFFFANGNTWIAAIVPEKERGKAFGWVVTFMGLGQFSCTILTEPLVNIIGIGNTFFITGIILLLITPLLFYKVVTHPSIDKSY